MNEKDIGNFIKELREEKKITQGELADILHVHRTAVNKWEKGKSIPLNDTLVLLSDYFNVSIDEILMGERSNKKNRNNLLLSLLQSNRKSKAIIKYISIITSFLLIVFLVYYFFTTYNSIHVYMLYGEGQNYKVKDSLLIVSNEKVYLRIGNISKIKDTSNIDVNKITLYSETNSETKIIFTGDPSQLLVEKRNNIELFSTSKLRNEYSNLYMLIDYNNEEETIELSIKRDFQNKGLLFGKKKETIETKLQNENYYKLNKDFVYDEETNTYTLKKKNLEIVYSVDENTCKVYEVGSNQISNYSYQFNLGILEVSILDKTNNIINKSAIVYEQARTTKEIADYNYFKANYLDKYFSETIGVN